MRLFTVMIWLIGLASHPGGWGGGRNELLHATETGDKRLARMLALPYLHATRTKQS